MSIHTHLFSVTSHSHRRTNAIYIYKQYINVQTYIHIISTAPPATRKRTQHLGDELVEHFQLRAVLHQMLALDERRPCKCMHVCIYVCINIYVDIYLHKHKHRHTGTDTHIAYQCHEHITSTCKRMCTCARTHKSKHEIDTQKHSNTCLHTHVQKHTNPHTPTYGTGLLALEEVGWLAHLCSG